MADDLTGSNPGGAEASHADGGPSPGGTQSEQPTITESALKSRLAQADRAFEKRAAKVAIEAIGKWREEHGLSDDRLQAFFDYANRQPDDQRAHDQAVRDAKRLAREAEEWRTKAEQATARLNATATRDALERAARKAQVHDRGMAVLSKALSDRVRVEDGEVVVIDEQGDVVHGQTVDEMVAAFVAENDYLVEARHAGGSGSSKRVQNGKQQPDLRTAEGRSAFLHSRLGEF